MGGVNAASSRDSQRATVCVPTTAMSAAGTVARAPIRTLSLYQYPVSSDPQPGRPVDAMTNRRMHAAHVTTTHRRRTRRTQTTSPIAITASSPHGNGPIWRPRSALSRSVGPSVPSAPQS